MLLNVPSRFRLPLTAKAVNTFPLDCFSGAKWMHDPSGAGLQSSTWNSRCAAIDGSSPSMYSPFGIDHAPSSLRAQNGAVDEHFDTSVGSPVQQQTSAECGHRPRLVVAG